ncbi:MAG: hypothetical protein MJA27_33770 [Pseudanabaenales cyanobacterium]|nr:hypothetical protein [Pseudanabaenales cyanobacterium]
MRILETHWMKRRLGEQSAIAATASEAIALEVILQRLTKHGPFSPLYRMMRSVESGGCGLGTGSVWLHSEKISSKAGRGADGEEGCDRFRAIHCLRTIWQVWLLLVWLPSHSWCLTSSKALSLLCYPFMLMLQDK